MHENGKRLRNLSCNLTQLQESLLKDNETNTNVEGKEFHNDDITIAGENELCKSIEVNGDSRHVVAQEKERKIPKEDKIQLLGTGVLNFNVEEMGLTMRNLDWLVTFEVVRTMDLSFDIGMSYELEFGDDLEE